jgi:uncharacterized protein
MPAAAGRASRAGEPLRSIANHRLEIRSDALKGRGVFARSAIAAGALIEAAPVVILSAADCPLVDQTILHDYYFDWDGGPGPDLQGEGRGAIALGLVSLCNHSRRPCARVRRNLARATLDLIALVPITAGDEITIDYNCPLWFEARD